MQKKKKYSKNYFVCVWEREREWEGETTFLWCKTMQRMEEWITNL